MYQFCVQGTSSRNGLRLLFFMSVTLLSGGWSCADESASSDAPTYDLRYQIPVVRGEDQGQAVEKALFTVDDSLPSTGDLALPVDQTILPVIATNLNVTDLDVTDLDVTDLDVTDLDATDLDATDLDATDLDGTEVPLSLVSAEAAAVSVDGSVDLPEIVSLRDRVSELDQQVANLKSRPLYRMMPNTAVSPPKFFATFESVLLQPAPTNTTGLIVETESGYSHVMFPWKILHSPRVSFGYDPGDQTLGWRVQFWQFRHSETFEANAKNGLLPIGFEGTVGYLSEDGDITTGLAFIEEGKFHSHIRTDVIDWELQRRLYQVIRLYAGLRYAKVKQGYAAATDRGNLQSYSQFRGLGPSVAMVFEHQLPLERLTLFAVTRGSMLFGKKRFGVIDDVNNLSQSLGDIDLRSGDDGANSMASNGELQLGIRYQVAQWFALRVALEAQHYANVGGANPVAVFAGPDSGLSGDSPLDDDLSLFGLNVAATLAY